MPRYTALGLIGLALVLAGPAAATEVQVTQSGKAFSERNLTLKAGDSVGFVNDDDVVHNVYSITEGHAFDLGAQQPGAATSHTFAAPGAAKVRCAIHPKMKLDVVVE